MKELEKQVEKLTVDLDKNTQATKRNSKAAFGQPEKEEQ